MAKKITFSKRELYERLHVSSLDLSSAKQYACHLLKKGWHSAPYERRGSIYMQQSAFTTSLVVSYARPFSNSYGWPQFPEEFWQYSPQQNQLHQKLIELRDQVFAHSDKAQYKVLPFRMNADSVSAIEGVPFHRLSQDECKQLVEMIDGIRTLLIPKVKRLRDELADGHEM
jgi:hypothetical protein